VENGFGAPQVREDSSAVETSDEQSVSDPPGSWPAHGGIVPYRAASKPFVETSLAGRALASRQIRARSRAHYAADPVVCDQY
jgi:hypothetical protein